MLRPLLAAVCVSAACVAFPGPNARGAEDFPRSATYLFFTNGELLGKSKITVAVENGRYVFTSKSEIKTGEESQSLSCRTEIDRTELRPIEFRYEGTQSGGRISGTVTLGPDSVRAALETAGHTRRTRLEWTEGMVLFQNYVPEHLAVLARRLALSTKAFERFFVLFPSDMVSSQAVATADSEIELAARPAPVICRKYVVSIRNSSPFYLYLESKHNSLVYMDFPANRTEVFLESVFGEHPATRYTVPVQPESVE